MALSDRNRALVMRHAPWTLSSDSDADREDMNALLDAARSEARAEAGERVKGVVEELRPWLRHSPGCAAYTTDHSGRQRACTCELDEVIRDALSAYGEPDLEEHETPAPSHEARD